MTKHTIDSISTRRKWINKIKRKGDYTPFPLLHQVDPFHYQWNNLFYKSPTF
jgi:hypothetical protein